MERDKYYARGTIKQEVIVQQNGIVTVYSPELRAGLRVEVIVILKESPMSRARSTVSKIGFLKHRFAA
jgi:hypothetical protein